MISVSMELIRYRGQVEDLTFKDMDDGMLMRSEIVHC